MKRIWSCLFGFVIFAALAVAQTDAPAPASAVLLIGDNAGLPDADAETAAMLVHNELRKHGISVSEPVWEAFASNSAVGSVYRIVMRPLGTKVFVRLSEESPIGKITAERQMMLAGIEEMVATAPRLVDALVGRKPIESTIDMENVTEQDAPMRRKISGESLWRMGIFGTSIPGTDIVAEPGFEFGWYFETPTYAVGTEFRSSGRGDYDDDDDDDFSFVSWSIGGRYFFNKQNITPYVGGGLAIIGASFEAKETKRKTGRDWFGDEWEWYDESEDDTGLGVYGVAGIELLRLTESRLNLEVRVDRPFFTLPSQDMMPITVGIAFSRNYVPGGYCLF